MTALLLALVAGYGTFLIYTAVAFGWRGIGLGPARPARTRRKRGNRVGTAVRQAVPAGVRPIEFVAVMMVLFVGGVLVTFAIFGGAVAALLGGVSAASAPVFAQQRRTELRRSQASEAWPRMIEEIRILTGSLGRPIPYALLEVGRRSPTEMKEAFAAAEREWLITTDFARTVAVLKDKLADATADAACETLLVAHAVGGTDVDKRLAALADDRIQDLQGRKDAIAKQAGVRFARRFVFIVPLGMAFAGLSIGTGRAAYQSPTGQLLVVAGVAAMAGCWWWAGVLMRLPREERVFG